MFTHRLQFAVYEKKLGQLFSYVANFVNNIPYITFVGSCKTQDQLESISIFNSPNSIAWQGDYVSVVECRPIVSAEYRLQVTFRQTDPRSSSTVSLRQQSFSCIISETRSPVSANLFIDEQPTCRNERIA